MLYYPGSLPPTAVLRQAALYWDFVATITDESHVNAMPDPLRAMSDAGLYHPVLFARTGLHYIFGQTFQHDLYALMQNLPADRMLPRRRLRQQAQGESPYEVDHSYGTATWMLEPSSVRRFPSPLMAQMIRQGLISVHRTYESGWPSETYTLAPELKLLLFSCAARAAVANISAAGLPAHVKNGTVFPHTDLPQAHQAGHFAPDRAASSPAWQVEVGGLLPTPTPGVSLAKLIKFRLAHDNERKNLMRSIDLVARRMSRYFPDPQQALSETQTELEESLAEFRKAARSRGVDMTVNSVMMTVVIGANAAGNYLVPGFQWVLGGVLGGVAVNLATRGLRPVVVPPGKIDVTYLHRMDKRLTP